MSHVIGDRVEDSSTSTGTGNITVSGTAPLGKRTLSAVATTNGDTIDMVIAHTTLNEWEFARWTRVSANVYSRASTPYMSSTGSAVNFSAGTKEVFGDIGAYFAWSLQALGGNRALINGKIVASVGSSALTLAVKTNDGNDPSLACPVFVVFRHATLANGDFVVLAFTAAHSLVVTSGSTLGTSNGTAFKLGVGIFNDGGTLRLGVANQTTQYVFNESVLKSSTAEGGAGAADSANTWYTGTAVTSKALTMVAVLDYPSGLATAGAWSAAPTTNQPIGGDFVAPRPVLVTTYSSGSGTHTLASGCTKMRVRCIGGGGGGAGGGTSPSAAGAGGNTTFGGMTANGGAAGVQSAGAAGGSSSGGDVNITGGSGNGAPASLLSQLNGTGGMGGSSYIAGGGYGSYNAAGTAAASGTGAGGGGGAGVATATVASGGGGGAGGYSEKFYVNPNTSYSYSVGAAGTAGGAGTNGNAGAAGGTGRIIVEEFFD